MMKNSITIQLFQIESNSMPAHVSPSGFGNFNHWWFRFRT